MKVLGWTAWGALVAVACGGPTGGECRYEPWRGTCTIESVTRVQLIERFPRSFVVMEAVYNGKSGDGRLAPQFRQQFTAPAMNEQELIDHLYKHGTTECEGQETFGPCTKLGDNRAHVPDFIPPARATEQVALGPKGCAKLDDLGVESASAKMGPGSQTASTLGLPETFAFEGGSGATTAEHAAAAQKVADVLRANPHVECLAIVGQISRDEPIPLAENRARAVKQLIIGHGIDPARVVTHGATVPMSGGEAQAGTATIDVALRSVRLSVVLVSGQGAQ